MAEIKQIKLPSGNTYDLKDAAARSDINDLNTAVASHSVDISNLQQMVAGGVSFNIVWTAADYASSTAPGSSKLSTIPNGVAVYYDNGSSSKTGTLAANDSTIGKFYLVYSKTQAGTLDVYDEYVTVGTSPNYSWEKIGDTQIDLTGVVTDVTLNKQTDSVIGSDATFTITQPTIALASVDSSTTGGIYVVNGLNFSAYWVGATASAGDVSFNNKDTKTVLTGVKTNNTNVKATASGGGVAWDSKDSKTVLTGVKTNNTNIKATITGGNATWGIKNNIQVVTGLNSSAKKLVTDTVTGVQFATTTASKATATTTQITVTGTGTTTTDNTSWLKGATVSSECLIIGAAAMDTQSTTQFTFSDVVVPIKDTAATTVATGATDSTGLGAVVITNVEVGDNLGSAIGSGATITYTSPTIALESGAAAGSGVISVAYEAAANGTASVIGNSATFSNTQPTIALSSGATAGTGVISLAYSAAENGTASVIGNSATFSVTQPTIALAESSSFPGGHTPAGAVSFTDISQNGIWIGATASGGNVAWNNKDTVTALTSSTSLTVTKGE